MEIWTLSAGNINEREAECVPPYPQQNAKRSRFVSFLGAALNTSR